MNIDLIHNKYDSNKALWLSLLMSIAALLLVSINEQSVLATMIIWISLGSLGTLLLLMERNVDLPVKSLKYQFWITFSLRIVVMSILHIALKMTPYWPWWDFGTLGGDEAAFWINSERIVLSWQDGTILQESALEFSNYFAWLQIMGFIRFVGSYLGSDTVFNLRLFLCMASALTVPYIYLMALRLFDERVAKIAATLAFWLPDYWFYSSTLLRDVFVSLIMVMIYYQVVTILYSRFSWWRLFLILGLNFGLLSNLRTSISYLNVVIITIGIMFDNRGIIKKGFASRPGTLILLSIGIVITFLYIAQSNYFRDTLSEDRFLDKENIRMSSTLWLDSAADEAKTGSLGMYTWSQGPLLRLSIGFLFVFLQPFPPWTPMLGGITMFPLKAIVTTISSFAWFSLVAFLPLGFFACLRYDSRKTLWLWLTSICVAIVMSYSLYMHSRWRLMFTPFLLIMIARGMVVRQQHRRLLKLTIMSMAGSIIVYLMLKLYLN